MLAVLKQVRNVDSKGVERWYAKERYAFESLHVTHVAPVSEGLVYFSGITEAGPVSLSLFDDERLLVFTEGMGRPFAFEYDSGLKLIGPVDF